MIHRIVFALLLIGTLPVASVIGAPFGGHEPDDQQGFFTEHWGHDAQDEKQSNDDALDAVKSKGAIPLSNMLEIFASYGSFTLVEVNLVRRFNHLFYSFKYIDAGGHVRKAYFDAQTGKKVR